MWGWRPSGEPDGEESLTATFELIGPRTSVVCQDLKSSIKDETVVQLFRWSLELEDLEGFHWPRYLARKEAVIVQLIFDLPPKGIFLSEVSSTLEYLAPTKPLTSFLPSLRKLAEDVTADGIPLVGRFVTSAVRNLIPARDAKNRVLWYIRRFYLAEKGRYGVEWRMSRRLIEEIGSRWTGTLGVVFVDVGRDEEDDPRLIDSEAKVCGCFGLKRRGKWRDWLHFRWRPVTDDQQRFYTEELIQDNRTPVAVTVNLT